MDNRNGYKKIFWLLVVFVGLPSVLYAIGDVPRRTLLKESISISVILSFSLMLAQFFIARTNRKMLSGISMAGIVTIHKVLGYTIMAVLLVHPFLLVVPRFFESGVDPLDAFMTIMTTANSLGIVVGICAWLLMLMLGLTSLVRKSLPISYRKWRVFHGCLAVLFILLASYHSINLGRHASVFLTGYVIVFAVSGILLLLKSYLIPLRVEKGVSR